jgi:hypothetical protein
MDDHRTGRQRQEIEKDMKLAQRINEQRDASIKQNQTNSKARRDASILDTATTPTFVRERFNELFSPFVLSKDFEDAWRRFDHKEVDAVLSDISKRWFQSHPAATALDLMRVVNSVLRKRAERFHDDHFSESALTYRQRYGA